MEKTKKRKGFLMSFVSNLVFLISTLTAAQEVPQAEPQQTERLKKVILQGYLGLYGPYKTLPAGLSANFIVSPHFMLTAEHAIGSNSFIFDGGRNTETYSLGFKYFPKPFEYSRGRLYYRFLANYTKLESEDFEYFSSKDWSYRANTYSATLSLG
jgi:hypothetical protein